MKIKHLVNLIYIRAAICTGTDAFHKPTEISTALVNFFENAGLSVAIDRPFSGSIVPMKYWQKEPNVKSVMIEIRRDLYMNEKTGTKSHNFNEMQKTISKIIKILAN